MDSISLLGVSILIVAVVINIFLTLSVYISNPKSATTRLFALLGLTISVWLIVLHFSLNVYSSAMSLLLIRLSLFFATPMSMFFFLLTYALPGNKLGLHRKYLLGIILLTLAVMLTTVSPYAFVNVTVLHNVPSPTPGPGIGVFAVFILSCLLLSLYVLFSKYKKYVGNEKQQIEFIMLGILLMYVLLIGTVLLPVVLFNNNSFVIFSPLYTLIFLLMTAYAIVRHKFLNIHLIVARSVSYTLVIFLLGLCYSAVFFLVRFFITKEKIVAPDIISSTLIALVIAFTFQTFKESIEKFTDKVFFKGSYSSNDLLFQLTKIMAAKLHLEDISHETLRVLLAVMHISGGAFLVFEKDASYVPISEGYTAPPAVSESLVKELTAVKRTVIYEDEENAQLKKEMRDHGISIALPLISEKDIIGILIFGEKKSGEIYSNQDIQVLEIFGPEVSVAISNAKSYEEIAKFNVTLKDEVDRATKDLKLANEKLKQLDLLKDDFVSVASHELRTPMTAIKSYLWMALAGKGGKLSEKQKYYLERSYNSVDRLIKLVNDMLNISRIESGRLTVDFQKVDCKQLVKEVVEEVMPRAKELDVTVKMDAPDKLEPVIADPDKIKEVLFNLIGNSLKFTPKKGVITSIISQTKGITTIRVQDTGVGITKEDLPKLFQKFGLLAGSYTINQPVQGTGLGLYISRSIVEIHGGAISATSEGRNKGAVFTFTLQNYDEQLLSEMKKKYKSADEKEGIGIIHTALT